VQLRGVLCELKSLCPSYIYDLWVKDRSVLAMASQKRRALSLEERVQVIKSSECGESFRSIAERLDVGRTQIQNTIKRKADVLSEFETENHPERKR